jgi:hypothetical protein
VADTLVAARAGQPPPGHFVHLLATVPYAEASLPPCR